MGNIRHPRRGSEQFWPRKRSRHSIVRVRSWVAESKTKPLGFIAYKVGMTHVQFTDTRAKSPTKGETVVAPVTILECPPMLVTGVAVYKQGVYGLNKVSTILASKSDKNLGKLLPLPKKEGKGLDSVSEYDDLRLMVRTIPEKVPAVSAKKPKMMEIGLGGANKDKLAFAQKVLGKELAINEVFEAGSLVDIRGVTKGKGFQGTVKRYGVPIRQHKAEKTKRGIGTLGSWTPKRVQHTVPQSGKMGFHLRTEYNKKIIKISSQPDEINSKGGIARYGVVRNTYMMVHGSVAGSEKREVVLTAPYRPNKTSKEPVPELTHISK